MALGADWLIDRQRLKRRLWFWRILAVLLLVAGLGAWLSRQDGLAGIAGGHVTRVELRGFISHDRALLRRLDALAREDGLRAVIVSIESPGGSVAGGEAIHAALQRLRERVPVVAVMGSTAASAGYMVALPAERIFARESTLTGSIGVLLQSFEASELMARLGVRAETLTSGPLKNQPSPFQPLTDQGRAALQAVIADMYDQFVAMVVAGRNLAEPDVRALADGRVMTGRQAVAARLVDAIGGEREARAWLEAEKQVAASLPVRTLEPRGTVERLLGASLGSVLGEALKTLVSEWLAIDGMRAVWLGSR